MGTIISNLEIIVGMILNLDGELTSRQRGMINGLLHGLKASGCCLRRPDVEIGALLGPASDITNSILSMCKTMSDSSDDQEVTKGKLDKFLKLVNKVCDTVAPGLGHTKVDLNAVSALLKDFQAKGFVSSWLSLYCIFAQRISDHRIAMVTHKSSSPLLI